MNPYPAAPHPVPATNAALNALVAGVPNATPITFGNLQDQVEQFLNSKQAGFHTAVLSSNNQTTTAVLVQIVQHSHMLLASLVHVKILKNSILGPPKSRPHLHLKRSKIHLMARIITVLTLGNGISLYSILPNDLILYEQDVQTFFEYAIEFVTTRLRSVAYEFTPKESDLRDSQWDHFWKPIRTRSKKGVWSNEYCLPLVTANTVVQDSKCITKGVFYPVAVYCMKFRNNFMDRVPNALLFLPHHQVVGAGWNNTIGQLMYVHIVHQQENNNDNNNQNNAAVV